MPTLENSTALVPPKGNAQAIDSNSSPLSDEEYLVGFLKNNPDARAMFRGAVVSAGTKAEEQIQKRADQLIQQAIAYVQDRRNDSWENLTRCDPMSVAASAAELVAVGLEPNASTGEGFLIPRKEYERGPNNQRIFVGWVCTACPGIRGMERQLLNSGEVLGIRSRAVYAQDHFETTLGTRDEIIHRLNVRPDPKSPNPIVASYTVIELANKLQHVNVKRIQLGDFKESSRMPLDVQARYLSQRPAQREVIHGYLRESPLLIKLVELEESSYRVEASPAEEVQENQNAMDGATEQRKLAGPIIKTEKPVLFIGKPAEVIPIQSAAQPEAPKPRSPVPQAVINASESSNNVADHLKTTPERIIQPSVNTAKQGGPADVILNERRAVLTNPSPETPRPRSRRL